MAKKTMIPSSMTKSQKGINPNPSQVKAIREAIQATHALGITDAQDWCADALHTSRRTFQQWESGDRAMHAAFWELFTIKTALIAHKSKKS